MNMLNYIEMKEKDGIELTQEEQNLLEQRRKKGKKKRLKNLNVVRVDMVGTPANLKSWLIVKKLDNGSLQMSNESPIEIKKNDKGTFETDASHDDTKQVDNKDDLDLDDGLGITVSTKSKTTLMGTLTEILAKSMALLTWLRSPAITVKSNDEKGNPLPASFVSELSRISKMLFQLTKSVNEAHVSKDYFDITIKAKDVNSAIVEEVSKTLNSVSESVMQIKAGVSSLDDSENGEDFTLSEDTIADINLAGTSINEAVAKNLDIPSEEKPTAVDDSVENVEASGESDEDVSTTEESSEGEESVETVVENTEPSDDNKPMENEMTEKTVTTYEEVKKSATALLEQAKTLEEKEKSELALVFKDVFAPFYQTASSVVNSNADADDTSSDAKPDSTDTESTEVQNEEPVSKALVDTLGSMQDVMQKNTEMIAKQFELVQKRLGALENTVPSSGTNSIPGQETGKQKKNDGVFSGVIFRPETCSPVNPNHFNQE